MVNKYALNWTPEAKSDLKSIFEYISCIENRQRAFYVITGIRKKAKDTSKFPTKHPKESYVNRDNIRFAVKWSYKIIFEIKGNTVRILSVFHTAQSPEKLLDL